LCWRERERNPIRQQTKKEKLAKDQMERKRENLDYIGLRGEEKGLFFLSHIAQGEKERGGKKKRRSPIKIGGSGEGKKEEEIKLFQFRNFVCKVERKGGEKGGGAYLLLRGIGILWFILVKMVRGKRGGEEGGGNNVKPNNKCQEKRGDNCNV